MGRDRLADKQTIQTIDSSVWLIGYFEALSMFISFG